MNVFAQVPAIFFNSFIIVPFEVEPFSIVVSQGCKADVKVMAVRIGPVVFTPFPIQDSRADTPIKNNVFDPLIALLSAFAKFLDNAVSFFGMSIEVSIYVYCSDYSIDRYMI